MKKKLTLVVTCVVLVAAMVIGGTLAYFTDTKTAENTFTMGNVKIKLDEAKVVKNETTGKWDIDEDAKRVTGNNYGAVYPGAVLPKDPTVTNTGTNPAYIRATVTVYNAGNLFSEFYPDIHTTTSFASMPDEFLAFVGELGDGWSIEDYGYVSAMQWYDYVYVLKYEGALEAGKPTTPIFKQVTIPADYDNADPNATFGEIKINVVAEAIQADGMTDWDDAFAKFDLQKTAAGN